ncbi:hypothetical protein ACNOYE_09355 [Nannocystaceae bacterium ST9]
MPEHALVGLLAAPQANDLPAWFTAIAEVLLLRSTLWVGETPHALVEIEFYLSGEGHEDPFIHGDPIQRGCATWYFHRAGTSYRGGTYKGLDITFGPADAFGGILIRSLRTPEGALICGSSLCVDHLLARSGHADVASLDAAIAGRSIDADASPLRLSPATHDATLELWTTARVGLTLKRAATHPSMIDYVIRPYRYLTAPAEIGKGRAQLVIALHERGLAPAEIAALARSPMRTIEGWLAAYAEGQTWDSTSALWGASLDSLDLCRLHGALAR